MNINIICVGKIKEKYWTDAIREYQKRLSAFCKLQILEAEEEKISNGQNPSDILLTLKAEGSKIAARLPKNAYTIALCIEGKACSSEELARKIQEVGLRGISTVNFIIGGSWGISEEVKQKADWKLSMSKMTFPHQMARVILCEQIYRAFEIIHNGKYHK